MNAIKTLERAAIEAFRKGISWSDFWAQHGNEVRRTEPYNRQRFARLVRKLIALVTSGDTSGTRNIGDDAPWETDDKATKPHETETHARLLMQKVLPGPGTTIGCPPPSIAHNTQSFFPNLTPNPLGK